MAFVISQSTEDIEILNYILKELGFGKINKQGQRVSRYIVQDISNLYLIILLFNGNIILPSRKKNFKDFLENFNNKILTGKIKTSTIDKNPINYQVSEIYPSLSNSWLSGFTDAEGCFTVSFLKNSNAFRLRYILSQKGDINLPILSKFILLFNAGVLEAHSVKSNYSYVLSGVKNCNNVYDYFYKYSPSYAQKYHNQVDMNFTGSIFELYFGQVLLVYIPVLFSSRVRLIPSYCQ